MYHSSSACSVSQTSMSVTGEVSYFHRTPETLSWLHHSYCLCIKRLCFLILFWGVKFWIMGAKGLRLESCLGVFPLKKCLWVWVTIKSNKLLLINSQMMDALRKEKKNLNRMAGTKDSFNKSNFCFFILTSTFNINSPFQNLASNCLFLQDLHKALWFNL